MFRNMKKILITLTMVAFAMTANAQFIIGGQFGFTSTGGTYTNHVANTSINNTKTTDFTFAPVIGYQISDNMEAGLTLIYQHSTNKSFWTNNDNWTKMATSFYGFAPYFRYYFAESGSFHFFCEAEAAFLKSPRTERTVCTSGNVADPVLGATSTSYMELDIVPGIEYKINDSWSADIFIDLVGLTMRRTATKTFNPTNDDVTDTDVDTYFGFVANGTEQTLNSHLNNIRVGLYYRF